MLLNYPVTAMSASDFTIKIDRPDVTADSFAAAIEAMLSVVRAVGDEVTGHRAAGVRWVIREMRAGSAYMAASPEIVDDSVSLLLVEQTLQAVGNGLAHLDRESTRPQYFSDAALKASKALAEIMSVDEVGTGALRFGSILVHPTKRVSANVDDLIVGKQKSLGTIDGRLVTLTVRDGYKFYVEDRSHGGRVECHVEKDALPVVLQAFDKRVIVRGIVWSRKDGRPQRIEVRQFEVVEEDATLPRVAQMRGVIREAWQNE